MRNLNTVWSKIFRFRAGQRVRIVAIKPCKKRGAIITQGSFGLNLIGMEGIVMEIHLPLTDPHSYLIATKETFYLRGKNSSQPTRDRIWCAPEELEVIT